MKTYELAFRLFQCAVQEANDNPAAIVSEMLQDDVSELLRQFFAELSKRRDKSSINVVVSDIDEALRRAGDLVAQVEDGFYFVLVGDPDIGIRGALVSRLALSRMIQTLLRAEVTVTAICLRVIAGLTMDICDDGTGVEFAATYWGEIKRASNE